MMIKVDKIKDKIIELYRNYREDKEIKKLNKLLDDYEFIMSVGEMYDEWKKRLDICNFDEILNNKIRS